MSDLLFSFSGTSPGDCLIIQESIDVSGQVCYCHNLRKIDQPVGYQEFEYTWLNNSNPHIREIPEENIQQFM